MYGQYNQIGRFLKVIGNKFYFKSSPDIWKTVWAILKSIFSSKIAVATLWATIVEIGLLFILLSGHTVPL